MSYRSFVEATLKELMEGEELPDYFGCLSSTVVQFPTVSFDHQKPSIEHNSPKKASQNLSPNVSSSRHSSARSSANKLPPRQRFFEEEAEEEEEESAIEVSMANKGPSLSPIEVNKQSTMQNRYSEQRTSMSKGRPAQFDDVEEDEEEDDFSDNIIKQRLPAGMKNFMSMSDDDDEIPKPIGLDKAMNISPQHKSPSPQLSRRDEDDEEEDVIPIRQRPKSKYLLETNELSNSFDDGSFMKEEIQKPDQGVFPKPVPKVKPLAQDYSAIFQQILDTSYDHFWPRLNTTVPRVTQESKIYTLTNPLKYVKLIRTLETKFAKHDPGKLSFKRVENTEIKEDYDEEDFEEPGF